MAIKIIELYKPGRGCGSTKAILSIINRLIDQNLRIGMVTNYNSTKRELEELDVWEGKGKTSIFTVQEICSYRARGKDFDVIVFCDFNTSNKVIKQCLTELRTAIIVKEIDGL